MKKKVLAILFSLILCLTIAAPAAYAQGIQLQNNLQNLGNSVYDGNVGNVDLVSTIGKVISTLLGFLGIVMVVLIIYAGFLYMTAGGDAGKVEKAQKYIINSIIGLVIILLAYAITDFVISQLVTGSGQVVS